MTGTDNCTRGWKGTHWWGGEGERVEMGWETETGECEGEREGEGWAEEVRAAVEGVMKGWVASGGRWAHYAPEARAWHLRHMPANTTNMLTCEQRAQSAQPARVETVPHATVMKSYSTVLAAPTTSPHPIPPAPCTCVLQRALSSMMHAVR